jgi:hypothetical protein
MIKRFASLALLFALSGCAGAAGLLQNPSGLSGTAAGVFGIPAATVASQVTAEITEIQAVAASLQMLRAQLDGVPVTLPPLPPVQPTPAPTPTPPVAVTVPPPAPVITPPPGSTLTPPGGPIVTPNSRHRQSRRQQEGWPPPTATVSNLAQSKFDWFGPTAKIPSTFRFDAQGRTVALK